MAELDTIMEDYLQRHLTEGSGQSFREYVERKMQQLIATGEFKHPYNIYKRGNIDRRVHSRLKNMEEEYQPSKAMALAYCIALGLSVEEAEELLALAGYRFEVGCLNDQIVKCCLEQKVYSANVVNSYIYRFSELYGIERPALVGSFTREAG